MIYLLNLLFVPLYYCIIKGTFRERKKANKLFATIACIHAVLFRALANPYNYVDAGWYFLGYYDMAKMSILDLFSPFNPYIDWGVGFDLLTWTLGQFFNNPVILYIIVALLSLIPLFWLYFKLSSNLFLTLLIFFIYPMMYLHGFGVIRQHLAVTIVLLSLFFVDKKWLSLLLALLALTIHTSAIVFFPYYLWRKLPFRKLSIKRALIYVLGGVVIGRMLFTPILSSLDRYSELLTSTENSNNIVPVFFIGGLVFLCFIQRLNNKLKGIRFEMLNFCFYGLAVSLFCIGIPGMGRLTLFFLYVVPIVITYLFLYSKRQFLNYSFLICVFVMVIVLRGIDFSKRNSFNYNYSFFWEKSTTLKNYL